MLRSKLYTQICSGVPNTFTFNLGVTWQVPTGGQHEPLLLYIGSRPTRSEDAKDRREKKAKDKLAAKRAAKREALKERKERNECKERNGSNERRERNRKSGKDEGVQAR